MGLTWSARWCLVGVLVSLLGLGAVSAATNAGDTLRTGWYPDQPTLTPALVAGGTFGQLFATQLNGQIYAQPLVSNGVLFVATETNWIYGLDPESGAVLWSRNVGTPWNASDLNCADLAPVVGITGTPVIDDAAGTAYFVKKTYVSGTSGQAEWRMHAVSVASGAERPGFPVLIQGVAQNNPAITFNATKELQRPGLLLMDGVVYAGFGAHCDYPPYQGWVVGVSTAGQIKAMWTAIGSGTADGSGIWQSGGGLVSDGSGRIIVSTGNDPAPNAPYPSSPPPPTLGESVVRLQVQPDGTLQAVSFFAPFDADNLDTWDADLSSGAPMALPSAYFGTPAHPNLLVEVGKQGYVYLLDRDALGGCRQGVGGGDDVVSRIGPYGGVWSRPTVWPGDGGYVYIPTASGGSSPSGSSGVFRYYHYGLNGNGVPTLALVATSADSFGFSSSAPVVTSDGTTSGSALVWIVWAPNGGGTGAQLRCYDPIPVAGTPHLRWSAAVGTSSKFNPPGVGPNGRIYVGTRDGKCFGFGAPIGVPLTGSTLAFPATTIGDSLPSSDVLTAQRPVTVTSLSSSNAQFTIGTPTPPLPAVLTATQALTVPVTFSPTQLGLVAGSLNVGLSDGTQMQFGLQGVGQSNGPQLVSSPVAVSFGGAPVGGHLASVVSFSNQGSAPLTITGETPPAAPFGVGGMPPIDYVMNPGDSVSINVFYDPTVPGYSSDAVTIDSTGGTQSVPLSGNASTPGMLQITPLSLTYPTLRVGQSANASFTVKNAGNSSLTITKSKPPIGGQFVNTTNLFEGSTVTAGQVLTETVQFVPTKPGFQTDAWVLNSDAPGGVQTVHFNGMATIPDPVLGGWTLNGSASLAGSTPGSMLILTPALSNRAGSAFWPAAVAPDGLEVAFDATIDEGGGADGMTFALADPSRGATRNSLGDNGGALGFGGIPGIAVALDTYQNGNDPSSNFVGVTTGPVGTVTDVLNWLATSTAVPPLRPATHRIGVSITGATLSVSVDGAPAVSTSVSLPGSVLLGFTGGTGGVNDRHAVSNVSISGHPPGPRLVTTADPVNGIVHLTWAGGTPPYTLERASDPGFTAGVTTLSTGTATVYDDPTLLDPTPVYYRVN